MTPEQRQEIADLIEREIVQLSEQIEHLVAVTQPVKPDVALGRLSRLEEIGAKEINEEALRKARRRLSDLKRARTQTGNPRFGRCVRCRKPIPFERLQVIPETAFCVACAPQ